MSNSEVTGKLMAILTRHKYHNVDTMTAIEEIKQLFKEAHP